MKRIIILLVLSTGLSCGAFVCPRQCRCGETFKCTIRDLRTLSAILPRKITRLDLSSSGITDVPVGAFENFTSLTFLSLANNSITHLSRSSFRGLRNLKELHLQNNKNLHLDNEVLSDVLRELPSLKNLRGNEVNGLTPKVINFTRTINISRDIRRESIHCDFRKVDPSECINIRLPKCQTALSLKDDEISKFRIQGCARATCKVKENEKKNLECYVSAENGNDTSWSILGDNSAVKLALWTFGLLAVTSNFLVLLTLLCNKEARKSALCVFVMNLLLGNILVGSHIVVLTVSDTVTYGSFLRFGQGRWETTWCVPLFFIKTMGFVLVILSLVLVTIERVLVLIFRAPHHMDCCRSIGYVVESWLVATVIAVVLWTKSSTWGYMCSTYANSKDFNDINKGVKLSLAGLCIILIFVYIYLLCRQKDKDHVTLTAVEYRTTVRMLLLLLSTFLSWVLPYMVLVFMVPVIVSVTLSMQTLAISITINACLHPFIYSYDNDHLENLYSALACKKDSCMFLPIAVQGQCYQPTHTKEPTSSDMELEELPHKRSLECVSIVEVKPAGQSVSETRTRLSPVTVSDMRAEVKRGSEISRSEGAVIIRNKSPTEADYDEDMTIVQVHSVPSSPSTSTRHVRTRNDEHSDCGTMSSDTNVTWISSDSPSNAHLRLGDGNSTTSSRASSIPLGKSAASPRIPRRKRLSSVKSDSERSEEDVCDSELNERGKSPLSCEELQEIELEETVEEKPQDVEGKRDKRMSPVEMIFRVLSPKMRNKRPKTGEGLASIKQSLEGRLQYKRSKSMVLGKDARNVKVKEDVTKPLSPVQLREKKPRGQSRENRNGVFVYPSAGDGLEMKPSEDALTNSEPCFRDRAGSPVGKECEKLKYLVIKPVPFHAKQKGNTKEAKSRGKLSRSLSEPFKAKVKIYENPVADLDNNNKVTGSDSRGASGNDSTPTSPTRRLAKLEEGDTVPDLPKGLKSKNRLSAGSTTSSTRLSNKSLEWDPSFTGDSYSEDDVMPPPPPPPPKLINGLSPSPPPSPTPSASTSERVGTRLAPSSLSSQYSLDWDPTGIQMRLSIASRDSTAGSSNQDDCLVEEQLGEQIEEETTQVGEPTTA